MELWFHISLNFDNMICFIYKMHKVRFLASFVEGMQYWCLLRASNPIICIDDYTEGGSIPPPSSQYRIKVHKLTYYAKIDL